MNKFPPLRSLGSITATVTIKRFFPQPSSLTPFAFTLAPRRMASTTTPIQRPRDPNTLSNYTAWTSRHITANFEIVFDQKKLVGNVVHQLQSKTDAETKEIIFDTSFLDISEIKVNGQPSKWEVASRLEPYGSALKIQLDSAAKLGETLEVDIALQTTDKCTALQWLTPAQTSNKKYPYMFSQCQAIHARSIFPCQDTPDVKSTFDFNITSPHPVIASGVPLREKNTPGSNVYHFKQKVPIPSYLFALASGDITEAPIGSQSVVATSPDRIADCKWELEADTDKFIHAIEKIIYPYVWGEYNVLILPPSFPYGGMENPIYTFATPSIISKDRENVDLVAHELAHSWSGNLVTSASWEHFWLNEGWTTYLERRIIGAVYGEPYRHFSAIIGWNGLKDSVEEYGHDHEFTRLVQDLKGKDPDDAFSKVPYEKGFNFLFYLENLLSREVFDRFIPHYFTVFKGKSLDSYEFKATILDFFANDATASKLLEQVDWEAWFYATGLPPQPKFDTSLVDVVYALADKWKSLPSSGFTPSEQDVAGLKGNQLVVFLETLIGSDKQLTVEQFQLMGKTYGLSNSQNIEVLYLYYQLGLKVGDRSAIEPTAKLLGEVGRMKYVRPLFRALKKLDSQAALDTFEKYKDFYHPICRAMAEKDLAK